ncbi:MAG: hypothetical protein WKF97_20320 [Chitinophagaceae bacterium]
MCGFLSGPAWGQLPGKNQPASNLRKKFISARTDLVQLDTLSIIPNTLFIVGISDTAYQLDLVNATLTWKNKPPLDSVSISYRVFHYKLNAITKRFSFDSIQNNFLMKTAVDNRLQQDDRFFNFGNLSYNGSFGRGISFGNSQDAVVTSNLNLQLNGFLADSIEMSAAITDNNIPIQPDGTTQQLNEFDRIFLQFKKRSWQLSLGDIDIRQNKSYFLNFYKRLQGAAFETTSRIGPKSTNTSVISGSIAKGKFTRNIFQGQEGNQGPYRLTGANNELFFVVLANTERVYIDGELLQRGEDQDYVINYNTAEVSFTPKRMITKDSRIQIEFEYADRNYLNTNLYFANETIINDRVKIRLGAFNNGDAKNSPINQTLDQPQKRFLNNIGDSVQKAFYPVAALDTFSAETILYKKVDTLISSSGQSDSIYIYSLNPDSARYNLSFIDVGQGNGDYLPDLSGANGKVYKWIAPVNAVRQGRYAPATFLVAPKKQQVMSLGLDYALGKSTTITSELGYSNYNVNTFSHKDKNNDQGYATKLQVTNTKRVRTSQKDLRLITGAGFEYVDARFRPLERLRNVEFTRDWGLPYIVRPEHESIINAGAQLLDEQKNILKYQFTSYKRGSRFMGYRNSIFHTHLIKGWRFNNQFNLTNTTTSDEKGYFLRPSVDISKELTRLKSHTLGMAFSVEHNELRSKRSDSVSINSFAFQTLQVYLRSPQKNLNRWGITWFTRTDKYPSGKELVKSDRSQNINLVTELLKNERHQFRLNLTYRDLAVIQQSLARQKADQSLLARGEFLMNEWKGLMTGNILYEVGAGQEQKRDFTFLEVPAGQGQYLWIDYDGNRIQSLNEFELAQFQDQARYIRIYTPTNDYIKADYNTFNYSININPRAVIDVYKATRFKKILSKLNLQSSMQVFKKEIASGFTRFNPFIKALNDTSLISLNAIFINSFSFNRFNTGWGIDLNNSRNNGKSLLTYGYETRRFEEWILRGRLNLMKPLSVDINLRNATNGLTTSNSKFGNRNYSLNIYSVEPRLIYTQGANFRLITGYRYTDKKNQVNDKEWYTSHALNAEAKYNILQSSSLLAKFTYSEISFSSRKNQLVNTNTTVSYIMLDGLVPGKNFLWNLDLTRRLSNNLEINIQYEGRKPGSSKAVHTGRASLRALL